MESVITKKEIAAMFNPSEGTWDDLIDRHLEYVSFHQTSPVAWYNIGFAFAEKGQSGNAEIAFKKALEHNPNMVEAMVNLGGLAFGAQNWDASIAYNEKALELNPKMNEAKLNVAYAHLMKGNHDEALKRFQAILEKQNKNANALYGMAVVYDSMDRTSDAREFFNKAVAMGAKPSPEFAKKMRS